MKVVELKNKNIKLVADRGKMIQSKAIIMMRNWDKRFQIFLAK